MHNFAFLLFLISIVGFVVSVICAIPRQLRNGAALGIAGSIVLCATSFGINALAWQMPTTDSSASSPPTGRDASENSAPTAEQLPSATHLPVQPAPPGSQVRLNPNFGVVPSWLETKKLLLTASGYPIVVAKKAVPVCENAFSVKDAIDAWLADDIKWLDSIDGCSVFPVGAEAEWTKFDYGIVANSIQLRVADADGSRKTLYADAGYDGSPVAGWLGFHTER